MYQKKAPVTATGPRKISENARKAAEDHMSAVLRRHMQHVVAEKDSRIMASSAGRDALATTSPWLARTRWRETYRGVRRDNLRALASIPRRRTASKAWSNFALGQSEIGGGNDVVSTATEEQKLSCILGAADMMITRCEITARHTSRLCRCWLLSSRPDVCQPKAFSIVGEATTQYRYRWTWKRFIAFLFRAAKLDRNRRHSLGIHLPPTIKDQLDQLWHHPLWESICCETGTWPGTEDSRYDPDAAQQASCAYNVRCMASPPSHGCQTSESRYFEEHQELSVADSDEDAGWATSGSADSSDGEGLDSDDDNDIWLQDDIAIDLRGSVAAPREDEPGNDRAKVEFLEQLFALSTMLITQEYQEESPGSALIIYYSGIFGFSRSNDSFLLARQFCSSISGLIYIQRLLFLEFALPLSAYQSLR